MQAVFALAIPVYGFPSFQNLLVLSFVFILSGGRLVTEVMDS